jgi:hypothetical protein
MGEDGYIWFVSPREVEDILFGHPGGMQWLPRTAKGKLLRRELHSLMRQDFS